MDGIFETLLTFALICFIYFLLLFFVDDIYEYQKNQKQNCTYCCNEEVKCND